MPRFRNPTKQANFLEIEDSKCSNCGCFEIFENFKEGNNECCNCGLVLSKVFDMTDGIRIFENDKRSEEKRHVGNPIDFVLVDQSLSTSIQSTQDGKILNKKNKRNDTGVCLNLTMKKIEEDCTLLLLLPKEQMKSKEIYKELFDLNKIKGKSKIDLIAACIYTACKIGLIPRTFQEISISLNVDKKKLGKNFKEIKSILNLQLDLVSYSDLIYRFCDNLKVSKIVLKYSIQLIESSKSLDLRNNQNVIAAASIATISKYLNEKLTILEIEKICLVSQSSIRKVVEIFESSSNFEKLKEKMKKL